MLVLTRSVQQSIVIDGKINVRILKIEGNHVKLGIDAPPDVAVNREEVQSRIDAGLRPVDREGEQ
jgi:carbon storage regulator